MSADPREAAQARAREFFQREFGTILDQGTVRRKQLERVLADSYLALGEEQLVPYKREIRTQATWLRESEAKVARLTEELAAARRCVRTDWDVSCTKPAAVCLDHYATEVARGDAARQEIICERNVRGVAEQYLQESKAQTLAARAEIARLKNRWEQISFPTDNFKRHARSLLSVSQISDGLMKFDDAADGLATSLAETAAVQADRDAARKEAEEAKAEVVTLAHRIKELVAEVEIADEVIDSKQTRVEKAEAEVERLRQWQVNVTVALMAPQGLHYDDAVNRATWLKARVQELEAEVEEWRARTQRANEGQECEIRRTEGAEAALQAAEALIKGYEQGERQLYASLEVAQEEIKRKDAALRRVECIAFAAREAAPAPSKTPLTPEAREQFPLAGKVEDIIQAVPEAAAVPAPEEPLLITEDWLRDHDDMYLHTVTVPTASVLALIRGNRMLLDKLKDSRRAAVPTEEPKR